LSFGLEWWLGAWESTQFCVCVCVFNVQYSIVYRLLELFYNTFLTSEYDGEDKSYVCRQSSTSGVCQGEILGSVGDTKGRWNAVGDSHEKDTADIVSTGSSLHVNGCEEDDTEEHYLFQ
jgi:hypothetical protein